MRTRITGSVSPSISFCVPTYDGDSPILNRFLASVMQHTPVEYEVVIVDCQREHLGYTKPQNLAMSVAAADILIASNDDVVVHKGWLQPMLDALTDGAWCVTPDMTQYDGPQVFAPYFMMWHRWAWEHIGGLDEQFVNWCSDIDLAYRLVECGNPPIRVKLPEPIEHVPGSTLRENGSLADKWNAECNLDLQAFKRKWMMDAEEAKYVLAERVGAFIGRP